MDWVDSVQHQIYRIDKFDAVYQPISYRRKVTNFSNVFRHQCMHDVDMSTSPFPVNPVTTSDIPASLPGRPHRL